MRQTVLFVVVICLAVFLAASQDSSSGGHPRYTSDNRLLPPSDYRDWVYLSSGLGMNYNTTAGHEMFTNVFVPQWAYQEFLKSGKWPDKTMFVVEERGATSKGSINKLGKYQTEDLMGYGVEVKDETRFPEKWAYFNFDTDTKSASANPKEGCWTCHEQHAAVEHSFVQFYPTLKPVAKKFGTYKESAEHVQ